MIVNCAPKYRKANRDGKEFSLIKTRSLNSFKNSGFLTFRNTRNYYSRKTTTRKTTTTRTTTTTTSTTTTTTTTSTTSRRTTANDVVLQAELEESWFPDEEWEQIWFYIKFN